jgi:glutathione S-transferase
MQLIGMLDSPYVRRVAISFQLLGLEFEHQSVSVFRQLDTFRRINPLVKAPSLVCDDGEVLMDSTLIVEYGEALARGRRSLMPVALAERQHAVRLIGVALVAMEKSVQILYERKLRPPERVHEPWLRRVTEQMQTAFQLLETEVAARPLAVTSSTMNQAGVCVAAAWCFAEKMQPDLLNFATLPALREFSRQAEALPEFRAAPHGEAPYPADAD